MLTRRAFLSAPAMFGPWQARPELTIEAAEARLWLPGGGVFTCPSGRARLLAVMRMREMDVAAVSFAADPAGEVQDVLALIGTGGQLLALERLTWRHGKRAELITRMAMLPDRAHISLQRDAARHEGVWRLGELDGLSAVEQRRPHQRASASRSGRKLASGVE